MDKDWTCCFVVHPRHCIYQWNQWGRFYFARLGSSRKGSWIFLRIIVSAEVIPWVRTNNWNYCVLAPDEVASEKSAFQESQLCV